MIRHIILYLALLMAITSASRVINVNLTPGLEPFLLMNPDYPNRSDPKNDIIWVIDTIPSARVSIHCGDFRFVQTEPCRESYVVINAGQPDEETLCGTNYDYTKISRTSRLTVSYYGGEWGGGSLKCVVQGTTTDNVYHYKGADPTGLDSGEAGLIHRPGRRTTSCKCGWVNKSPARIYGGREVRPNEFPWLVALITGTERRMPICGGSIITEYHVLTAAHCVTERGGKLKEGPYSVLVGEHDWQAENNPARQLITVKNIIIYQNYSSYIKDFDIAILNLKEPIKYSDRVGPVCLPNGRLDVRDQWLRVMGWGRVNEEYYSTIAKTTYLKGVDINICSAKYLFLMRVDDPFHVCTWAKNTDACRGDSGGPLVWLDPDTNRYTQSSLVSHSMSCAGEVPSVNTDVSYFLDWIQLEIQNSNPRGVTCSKV